MKYRVTERPWDIERRRYAVEQLRYTLADGTQGWGVERFFSSVLDAHLFLAQAKNGPRVIAEVETVSVRPSAASYLAPSSREPMEGRTL